MKDGQLLGRHESTSTPRARLSGRSCAMTTFVITIATFRARVSKFVLFIWMAFCCRIVLVSRAGGGAARATTSRSDGGRHYGVSIRLAVGRGIFGRGKHVSD